MIPDKIINQIKDKYGEFILTCFQKEDPKKNLERQKVNKVHKGKMGQKGQKIQKKQKIQKRQKIQKKNIYNIKIKRIK